MYMLSNSSTVRQNSKNPTSNPASSDLDSDQDPCHYRSTKTSTDRKSIGPESPKAPNLRHVLAQRGRRSPRDAPQRSM